MIENGDVLEETAIIDVEKISELIGVFLSNRFELRANSENEVFQKYDEATKIVFKEKFTQNPEKLDKILTKYSEKIKVNDGTSLESFISLMRLEILDLTRDENVKYHNIKVLTESEEGNPCNLFTLIEGTDESRNLADKIIRGSDDLSCLTDSVRDGTGNILDSIFEYELFDLMAYVLDRIHPYEAYKMIHSKEEKQGFKLHNRAKLKPKFSEIFGKVKPTQTADTENISSKQPAANSSNTESNKEIDSLTLLDGTVIDVGDLQKLLGDCYKAPKEDLHKYSDILFTAATKGNLVNVKQEQLDAFAFHFGILCGEPESVSERLWVGQVESFFLRYVLDNSPQVTFKNIEALINPLGNRLNFLDLDAGENNYRATLIDRCDIKELVEVKDEYDGNNILQICLKYLPKEGSFPVIKSIIDNKNVQEKADELINHKNNKGEPVLISAVKEGRLDITSYLLPKVTSLTEYDSKEIEKRLMGQQPSNKDPKLSGRIMLIRKSIAALKTTEAKSTEAKSTEAKKKKALRNAKKREKDKAKKKLEKARQILEKARQILEKTQFDEFLTEISTGGKEIDSIDSLPEFLRPKFEKILQDGHKIKIKGSAVNQVKGRKPSDLDIEIIIKDFASIYHPDKINDIFPGAKLKSKHDQGGEFAVNLEYKIGEHILVDISVYDELKLTDRQVKTSWLNSKEQTITFHGEEITKSYAMEDALRKTEGNVEDLNLDESEESFQINNEARYLVLRTSLQVATGFLTIEKVTQAFEASSIDVRSTILNELTTNSHFEVRDAELWNGAVNGKQVEDCKAIIQEGVEKKIEDYVKNHNLSQSQELVFYKSFLKIAETKTKEVKITHPWNIVAMQVIQEIVTEKKKAIECNDISSPPGSTKADSSSTLKASGTKEMSSSC